jgi:hypothetical protein
MHSFELRTSSTLPRGTDVGGVRGKEEGAGGDDGFARLQKNVEGNIGCGGLGIVTRTAAIGWIEDHVAFPLKRLARTAGELQVNVVTDVITLAHFVNGGNGHTPIIEALRFPELHRAARQKQRDCDYDQHVDGCAEDEPPENPAGASKLAPEGKAGGEQRKRRGEREG